MSTYIEYNNAGRLPNTGSKIAYGTAELRAVSGDITGASLIGLGTIESCSMKDTGEDLELEDESGATEAFLMMNEGTEVSLTCRFTRNTPAPRKGWFLSLSRPTNDGAVAAPLSVQANVDIVFLITNVTLDWGNKQVRKYTITGKNWMSLDPASGTAVARVTAATGAIGAGNYQAGPSS